MAGNETFSEANKQFVLGDYPIVTEPRTIASGSGALKAGTVLGKVTSTKKRTLALGASNDGSETPVEILAVDVDATSADATAHVYVSGRFASDQLIYGAGVTAGSTAEAFEATPLFLTEPIILQD